MDLDLPAPKRPWIQRSSRLVNSAIVTAHKVPRTWPSSSAAKDSAVVRIHACDSLSMWNGMRTSRNNCPHRCSKWFFLFPSMPSTATCTLYMPSPRWYLHGGVRATAVISPVGLVHPNIHMSFSRNVAGTSDLPLMTAASSVVRPSPEARYRSFRTPSWSCAKKLIASSDRKATSKYLGLHWRWILAAGNSSLFLVGLGVMESTSPKIICHFLSPALAMSSTPTSAMSLPVPIGLTLWWCDNTIRRRPKQVYAKVRPSSPRKLLEFYSGSVPKTPA